MSSQDTSLNNQRRGGKPPAKRLTRPPVKRHEVMDALRRAMVSGTYAPGSRLPTRLELCRRFNTGEPTLQAAMAALTTEGFVCSRGRHGTFVSETPPHLCRYGLVFARSPADGNDWSRFYTALTDAACRPRGQGSTTWEPYFRVDASQPDAYGDRARFLADLAEGRLAGVLYATTPGTSLGERQLRRPPPVPAVAFTYRGTLPQDWAVVDVDAHDLVDKALDYLAARGRRRLAVLTIPGAAYPGVSEHLAAALAARGMATDPTWNLGLPHTPPGVVRLVVHLLMTPDRRRRPDAMLVLDDNLLESASLGLLDAGVRAGEDFDLVSHANFPVPTVSHVPVKRVGFDVRKILGRCLELLEAQRQGTGGREQVLVPAEYEPDL